jgi:branched-subunit amino acid transport protein
VTIGFGLILAMAAGTYLMRLAGLVLARRGLPGALTTLLPLFPAALLAGLVVVNGFSTDGEPAFDERIGGMAVAVLLAVRGRSMGTVVVAGVATTAVLRLARSLLGI